MIRLKHIYKSYPLGDTTVDVLQDVSLHIRPREFVVPSWGPRAAESPL